MMAKNGMTRYNCDLVRRKDKVLFIIKSSPFLSSASCSSLEELIEWYHDSITIRYHFGWFVGAVTSFRGDSTFRLIATLPPLSSPPTPNIIMIIIIARLEVLACVLYLYQHAIRWRRAKPRVPVLRRQSPPSSRARQPSAFQPLPPGSWSITPCPVQSVLSCLSCLCKDVGGYLTR